ncbi:MAG: CRISPR-associated protein [Verrucomicrobia bacterium A1]|nr:MAG: CRISPR-associated protein [Verrucomicrobia bacterium A1]
MKKLAKKTTKTTDRSPPPSVFRFPSSVLIAVTGMSPAILTETAWALAQESPPVIPSKVVAFGTSLSRDRLRKDLIESGVWANLRRTLKAGPDELVFGDAGEHIRVFSHRGRELEDIRSPDDNAAAADFILEHLRQFAENPEMRIVASIAGGRKTMGALLYAAMTLIGRETDRITHVLADESLERRKDPSFFYPCNAGEAKGVTLADVPFVPLRNKFVELGRMPGGFTTLVRHYTRALRDDAAPAARVRFDDSTCTVTVDGTDARLPRRAYIVLKFAAHLSESNATPIGINVTDDSLRQFIAGTRLYPEWAGTATSDPDLRRELNAIRHAFDAHGISWKPGLRRDALRLPPFRRTEDGKRKTEDGA